MPSHQNRLDKISTQLTSRQHVYKLIDKSREYQTMDDFISWFLEEENQAEIADVFVHSAELIREQMKGKPDERIQEAVKKSYREGQFLFSLNSRTAFSFHSEFYRHAYNGLMLVDLMRQWMLESNQQENKPVMEGLQRITTNLKIWKHRATRHLYHLYHEKLLAEAIGNKHFDGRQLMFEHDRQKLELFIRQAEAMAENQNDSVETSVGMLKESNDAELQTLIPKYRDCLIDLDSILAEVKADLPAAIEREEQMAKMDVYSGEEQHDKARAILKQYGTVTA